MAGVVMNQRQLKSEVSSDQHCCSNCVSVKLILSALLTNNWQLFELINEVLLQLQGTD